MPLRVSWGSSQKAEARRQHCPRVARRGIRPGSHRGQRWRSRGRGRSHAARVTWSPRSLVRSHRQTHRSRPGHPSSWPSGLQQELRPSSSSWPYSAVTQNTSEHTQYYINQSTSTIHKTTSPAQYINQHTRTILTSLLAKYYPSYHQNINKFTHKILPPFNELNEQADILNNSFHNIIKYLTNGL